jgi:branched-chain amino acid transport system substrate-binding protein
MRQLRIVRVLVILALTSLTVGLPIFMSGYGLAEEKATAKPIKIGYVLPISGAGAHMGTLGGRVARIWVEEINKKGGIKGHPVVYLSADDESDATRGVMAFRKLETDGAHAILGSYVTGVALAIQPIAAEIGVPHFATCGSGVYDERPPQSKWGFRINIASNAFGEQTVAVAKLKYNAKSIAHIYDGGAYGKRWIQIYKMACKKYEIPLVAEESYDPSGTEFSAIIGKVWAKNPNFVLVTGNTVAGGLLIKQIREMGWNVPIGIIVSLATPDILKAVGDYFYKEPGVWEGASVSDIWRSVPKDMPERREVEAVGEQYFKKYGEEISFMASLPLPSLKAIEVAVKKALDDDPKFLDRDVKTIRSTIRNNLETMPPFWTVLGQIQLTPENHNGWIKGGLIAAQFQAGKLVTHPEYAISK